MSEDAYEFSPHIMGLIEFYQQAIFGVERKKNRRKPLDENGQQTTKALHVLQSRAYDVQVCLWGNSGGATTTLGTYKQAVKVWMP